METLIFLTHSAALAVAAVEAGAAAVHQDHGLGAAAVAHGGGGRERGAVVVRVARWRRRGVAV